MIKLIGFAVIAVCAVISSVMLTASLKNKIAALGAFSELLLYIKGSIECFRLPPAEIFAAFENNYLESCGFLEKLRTDGFCSALEKDDAGAGEEARLLLARFAASLGDGYKNEQTALCDFYIGQLGIIYDRERCVYASKMKLYRWLPLLIAAAVIILFI